MMRNGNQDQPEKGAQEEAFPALREDINSVICIEPVDCTLDIRWQQWLHLNELTGANKNISGGLRNV